MSLNFYTDFIFDHLQPGAHKKFRRPHYFDVFFNDMVKKLY